MRTEGKYLFPMVLRWLMLTCSRFVSPYLPIGIVFEERKFYAIYSGICLHEILYGKLEQIYSLQMKTYVLYFILKFI